MADKKYPREIWSTATTLNRPGLKSCKACGIKFDKGERFAVLERQVDWFRGNDEVEAYHKPCVEKLMNEREKENQERG